MDWIRLPGLLGVLYKCQILQEIGGLIGKVEKLDFKTDNGSRGQFARMAVFINRDSLSNYDLCPFNGSVKSCDSDNEEIAATLLEKERTMEALESFGPWMLVKLGIGCYSDGGVWSSVVEQWKGYTPAGTLPENLILD
ncbi:hypothetical protein Goarm_009983 [Gossypium armourianum]|uniref:DUF4283 domain-containing protein n=1 Tax=Gossypium armourianum TaxID=34283 RepID=A0A7J9JUK5_9ROSI|nr:hypothetical protein [Gossypium armourianum]